MDKFDFAIQKVMSARFWMAIMFSATACYCMAKGILKVEAFMTLAAVAVNGYFNRDRSQEGKDMQASKSNDTVPKP